MGRIVSDSQKFDLAIGIEDVNDLIEDLEQALAATK